MKKKTKNQRKYPKKWSAERVRFENYKRDYTPKKSKTQKKSQKINKIGG